MPVRVSQSSHYRPCTIAARCMRMRMRIKVIFRLRSCNRRPGVGAAARGAPNRLGPRPYGHRRHPS
eukprot:2623687-Prymnesium_polylepis.1